MSPLDQRTSFKGKPFVAPITPASPHVFDLEHEDYVLPTAALGTTRAIKVIHIGAGFGGINFAYQVKRWMQNVELVIYEKNVALGGTWQEQKYPGCACDIPSHSYQFSWSPTTSWSKYYSSSDEIEQYALNVAKEHDLNKYIRLEHKMIHSQWDEKSAMWNVVLERPDGTTVKDSAHVLINGSGVLNTWKWPDIEGREKFKGDLLHTAIWPQGFDLKGKRVGVIGVGSTAIQIIPTIQPIVKELKAFIRSPTWITPAFAAKYAGPDGSNFTYTQEQKDNLNNDSAAWLEYRKGIEFEVSSRYKFAMKDSVEQKEVFEFSRKLMEKGLASKPELMEKLIPTFAVGCRRPTPGGSFMEAIVADNTEAVFGGIASFNEKGIVTTDGTVHELDVIICATGFNTAFIPNWPVIGRNGINLRDQWADIAEGYLGITVANMPNYFITVGPSSPVAHGSFLPLVELISRYQLKFIKKLQLEPSLRSFEPKADLIREFQVHRLTQLQKTSWSTHCSSWFKGGRVDGPLVALHPGSRTHYFQVLDNPRFEDYDYVYEGNRFTWMGSGQTTREEEGRDLCWYLDDVEKPFLYEY